jgi:hypothetical protein
MGLWRVGEIKQQALMVVLVGVDCERVTIGRKGVKESRW